VQINLGIASREETVDHHWGDYSHLLCLLDPERGEAGIMLPAKVRVTSVITFHDLDDIEIKAPQYLTCVSPQEEHILEIFNAFSHLKESNGEGILVQCEAGISRSTAAAVLGLCHLGVSPEEAMDTVVGINPLSLPNRRMLRLGGKLLGDRGKLLGLAEEHRRRVFAKHNQRDPIEDLKNELFATGYWTLRWKCITWFLHNFGRSQKAGSDQKMIARLKMKLSMKQGKTRI